jgi:hypothetical protein
MFVLVCVLLFTGSQACAEQSGRSDPEIDKQAVQILKRSTEFISKAGRFSFTTELGFDVVQDSGQKIEFGSHREVTIKRPDHARIEFDRRDGLKGGIIFDGKEITVYNTVLNVYAKASKKGNLGTAIDYLEKELHVPLPLQDFLSTNAFEVLMDNVESGRYAGESIIAGVACDHLAFRSDRVDYQVWVSRGDKPLPRRIVITYKREPGQPQFWAQFVKWNLSPDVPDSLFTFKPPKGAEQISFASQKYPVRKEGGEK